MGVNFPKNPQLKKKVPISENNANRVVPFLDSVIHYLPLITFASSILGGAVYLGVTLADFRHDYRDKVNDLDSLKIEVSKLNASYENLGGKYEELIALSSAGKQTLQGVVPQ